MWPKDEQWLLSKNIRVTIRCLRSRILTNPTNLVPNLSHIFGVLVTLFRWKRPRTQQCDHMPPTVAGPFVTHNEKNVRDHMHIVTHFCRVQCNFLYQCKIMRRNQELTLDHVPEGVKW